ncbi:MAG: hypothetical protein QOE75_368 [Solirubrobacterales bacterium]|nr:hypothetical protein [Solirubrobacterales bacterium]
MGLTLTGASFEADDATLQFRHPLLAMRGYRTFAPRLVDLRLNRVVIGGRSTAASDHGQRGGSEEERQASDSEYPSGAH